MLKKKKSGKSSISSGVMALIVAGAVGVVGVIGVVVLSVAAFFLAGNSVNTLQTYTNRAEGIKFAYPGDWEEGSMAEVYRYVADDNTIMYLLVENVNNDKQVIMNICKYPTNQTGSFKQYDGNRYRGC